MMQGVIIPYRNMPIEALRPVAEAWAKEACGQQFGIEINADAHLLDLDRLANSPTSALLVLVQAVPVGYIGIEFWQNPLGSELAASEKYWYVAPQARGRDSIRLLKEARKYAKQVGAAYMFFTASKLASESHDAVCKLYEHNGFKAFETTYIAHLGDEKGETIG